MSTLETEHLPDESPARELTLTLLRQLYGQSVNLCIKEGMVTVAGLLTEVQEIPSEYHYWLVYHPVHFPQNPLDVPLGGQATFVIEDVIAFRVRPDEPVPVDIAVRKATLLVSGQELE